MTTDDSNKQQRIWRRALWICLFVGYGLVVLVEHLTTPAPHNPASESPTPAAKSE